MASLAGIYGLSAPKFSENMDPRDRAALSNYIYQLQEQLGYVLSNLDESNFSADMQQTAAASRMAAPASAMMQAAEASREAAKAGRKK